MEHGREGRASFQRCPFSARRPEKGLLGLTPIGNPQPVRVFRGAGRRAPSPIPIPAAAPLPGPAARSHLRRRLPAAPSARDPGARRARAPPPRAPSPPRHRPAVTPPCRCPLPVGPRGGAERGPGPPARPAGRPCSTCCTPRARPLNPAAAARARWELGSAAGLREGIAARQGLRARRQAGSGGVGPGAGREAEARPPRIALGPRRSRAPAGCERPGRGLRAGCGVRPSRSRSRVGGLWALQPSRVVSCHARPGETRLGDGARPGKGRGTEPDKGRRRPQTGRGRGARSRRTKRGRWARGRRWAPRRRARQMESDSSPARLRDAGS